VLLGADDANDVIRNDRVQIDLNTSYRITKKLTVYAEAINITNAPQIDYLGARNRIYQIQYYGYSLRGGVKYRF
jgi:outer membrane receptor protein involved in Fe transport